MNYKLFSSESVTEGHPDKVADYISDAILDAALEQDPESRVACETAVTTDYALLFGEITTKATIDFDRVVRDAIKEIGYNKKEYGYNAEDVVVDVKIKPQSPDIALGVDEKENKEQGAGDQGLMFGYATNETITLMPLPIYLAHRLSERLSYVRKLNIIEGLRPDGKTQVTVGYNEKNQPAFIHTVVLSTQHDESWDQEALHNEIKKHVIEPVLRGYDTTETIYQINPTGRFVIGGPHGDAGLTGRKIIVDTYGGYARHGGGAFSGKDASKVDRSAAYMARYIAKNIVGSGIADQCEIQIAYAIGLAKPVSLRIDTFGTEKVSLDIIYETVQKNFDLRPASIIKTLELKRPIFKKTSNYGHFGREDEAFTWEKLDKIELFRKLV
ncbi:MAG: methionine adenosyltransferase [Tenericutes bacterium GWC2_34_14]|nr:MAG: methionine adenosyltransferase [Tenericutes bacterium GWA2_35_7]OHE28971.1 MAG: methionine adenosyltransferase [Tenericutes bacterium GWC2_34_14]OHE33887.1 MAG: methionine adenosyltransferase [Tenericutes bacterium GWE2_34_108]OHE36622.1 MAG: methionine adenosyltransferase [Tenericutes bacterium GWF1_35_14]OHE37871.1 MAG: methionine adenosyltransferase [Tenericutes bacterium GWF2_35_184]OHE45325.1 MAG: methionine adenosyltransferase [Tenericutes bacterium RIFOXYA2_FULL_36_32]OHE45965.